MHNMRALGHMHTLVASIPCCWATVDGDPTALESEREGNGTETANEDWKWRHESET